MKNPLHPGGIVKDCIEDMELSVAEAASVLGVTRSTLSRIINGKSSISPKMALRLAQAFGSTPEMWLRLQSAYDAVAHEQMRTKGYRKVGSAKDLDIQISDDFDEPLDDFVEYMS